jgi:hypothetical protein
LIRSPRDCAKFDDCEFLGACRWGNTGLLEQWINR